MPSEIRRGSRAYSVLVLFLSFLSLARAAWPQSFRDFNHSYAVVIGIRSYGVKQWPDLPYGRADAEAMVTYLKSQGFEVSMLFDAQATKRNIMETIIQLATRLQPDDRVVFYFSGHGTIERNGDETWGYIVPYGGTEIADYISNIEIQDLSRRMKTARHQLFIFDSCFSGQMITRSGGVSPDIPNYIEEVTKRIAREGLAAGGRDQSVLDSGPDGRSVFTSTLLKGLACKADLNGDGFITFAELEAFVLPLATNSFQTPAPGVLPGHEGGEFVFRSPCGRTAAPVKPEALPKILVKRGDSDQLAEAKQLLKASQFAPALPLFLASADTGDPEGMFYMGILYDAGWGVRSDHEEAGHWYEKAAAAGSAQAMQALGARYDNGFDVAQDYSRARQWYEKAAAAGNGTAMTNLGYLYKLGRGVPKDYGEARHWFEKGAAAGDGFAMYALGNMYFAGEGFDQDSHRARQWYEKAAAAGNEFARNQLEKIAEPVGEAKALLMENQYFQAYQLFQSSARRGDAEAMFYIGRFYEQGWYVPQDYGSARLWYEKAAARRYGLAMSALGGFYLSGHGVPRDYAMALQWYERGAAIGNTSAMIGLGRMYANGLGVPQDYAQARQWYEKAAAAGDTMATVLIRELPQK